MKLRVLDRLLAGVMGLILIGFGACGLLATWWSDPMGIVSRMKPNQKWMVTGACAVLILLGLYGLSMLLRRRRDKGFVIQRTEYGDMSISMKAMENMVRKCVDSHEELTVNGTSITRARDGVQVEARITLPSGANIPLTVNALQRQIKQYITSCSGIDVLEVRVKVETDMAKLAAPVPAPALENPVVPEAEKQPEAAEQLCRHQEEPDCYAEEKAEQPESEEAPDEEPVEAEAPQNEEAVQAEEAQA